MLIEEGYTWDASVFPIRHDRYGILSAPTHTFWIEHGTASRGLRPMPDGLGPVGKTGDGGSPASGFGPASKAGKALLEIPASTIRLAGPNFPVGGGGYFRILPYRWTEFALARVNRLEQKPAVFYVHPWEIDPGQPRQQGIPWLSRFRHYRNLGCAEHRIRRLVAQFRFDSIAATVVSHAARRL